MEAPKKRGGHGRRKIEIEYIDDKIRRHITFSKRKAGISKKAYELSRLTGAQVHPAPPANPLPPSPAVPLGSPSSDQERQPKMATFRGRCAQVLLLISSERGQIYSFATPKLQPILVNEASKTLIEQCLNAADPAAPLALECQPDGAVPDGDEGADEAVAYADGEAMAIPEGAEPPVATSIVSEEQ